MDNQKKKLNDKQKFTTIRGIGMLQHWASNGVITALPVMCASTQCEKHVVKEQTTFRNLPATNV